MSIQVWILCYLEMWLEETWSWSVVHSSGSFCEIWPCGCYLFHGYFYVGTTFISVNAPLPEVSWASFWFCWTREVTSSTGQGRRQTQPLSHLYSLDSPALSDLCHHPIFLSAAPDYWCPEDPFGKQNLSLATITPPTCVCITAPRLSVKCHLGASVKAVWVEFRSTIN